MCFPFEAMEVVGGLCFIIVFFIISHPLGYAQFFYLLFFRYRGCGLLNVTRSTLRKLVVGSWCFD